jgi:uncharacterized protein (DUF2062 family)
MRKWRRGTRFPACLGGIFRPSVDRRSGGCLQPAWSSGQAKPRAPALKPLLTAFQGFQRTTPMRRFFQNRLPDHHSILRQRWLRPVRHWLVHPNLWHLHRRSVAGGVAVGLLCGLIPGPLQMIVAVLLAMLFRVNLPVAAFTTLYTNPFTIVPLYLLAYQIGIWVIGSANANALPAFPDLHWSDGLFQLWSWLKLLGKPLLVGLPILAVSLAIVGYAAVRLLWRLFVVIKWRRRHQK